MDSETTFVLVRTNKSCGGGDDDYDVCDGEKVIGRIVRHPQALKEAPWLWTIIAEGRKRSLSDRGYAVSREQAMAQFRAQWSCDDLVCHRVANGVRRNLFEMRQGFFAAIGTSQTTF